MKQHKWSKEIKAWADGAEIEMRVSDSNFAYVWTKCETPMFDTNEKWEYRIKQQPKEPQYLYVSQGNDGKPQLSFIDHQESIGKIPLIVESNDDTEFWDKLQSEVDENGY